MLQTTLFYAMNKIPPPISRQYTTNPAAPSKEHISCKILCNILV